MAFDREAAKAEGYSDDEINAYLQAEAEKNKQATPVTADPGEPPAPVTKFEPVGSSAASVGTSAGLAVAPYALPAAGAAAAAIGGNKLYGAWSDSAKAAQALADAKLASEQGIANRAAMKAGGGAPQMRPVAPTGTPTYNVPTSNVPQIRAPLPTAAPVAPTAGAPMAGPVAPTGMPAPAQAPSVMAQLRSFAANKILPMAGNVARGSVAPAMLFHSGELNANEDEELRRRRMMQPTITR